MTETTGTNDRKDLSEQSGHSNHKHIVDAHGDPYRGAEATGKGAERVKRLKKNLRFEKALNILLTAIIAASAVGQWFITYFNNKSSGEQTDKIIQAEQKTSQAAANNSAAATRFSQSAESINREIESAVGKLADQAVAARTLAELSRSQFGLVQRPWISVETQISVYQPDVVVATDSNGNHITQTPQERFKTPSQIIAGDLSATFTINFRNVGHTPATHESGYIQMRFIDLPLQIRPGYDNVTMPKDPTCERGAPRKLTSSVIFPDKGQNRGHDSYFPTPCTGHPIRFVCIPLVSGLGRSFASVRASSNRSAKQGSWEAWRSRPITNTFVAAGRMIVSDRRSPLNGWKGLERKCPLIF
jgi:hypothetical protein